MKVALKSFAIFRVDLQTRLPFKYGIATMTSVPHVFVRVVAEFDGCANTGVAADHLPPKWFTKNPTGSIPDEVAEMLRVIINAGNLSAGLKGNSVFDVWMQLYTAQSAWGEKEQLPPLLTQFGASLIERALIEAFCRHLRMPFAAALRSDPFGFDLAAIHPGCGQSNFREMLPQTPLPHIVVRHTLGLSDPLRSGDIPTSEMIEDGLPQSLEDSIRKYGLRHFKIKISGHLANDVNRLRACTALLQESAGPDFRLSLDGNECFTSLPQFAEYWKSLVDAWKFAGLSERLLFVEQPLHRNAALDPSIEAGFAQWPDHPPIIIDESDATLGSAPHALKLGYSGTSHKNCKGVIKGIANKCLLESESRRTPPAHERRRLVQYRSGRLAPGPGRHGRPWDRERRTQRSPLSPRIVDVPPGDSGIDPATSSGSFRADGGRLACPRYPRQRGEAWIGQPQPVRNRVRNFTRAFRSHGGLIPRIIQENAVAP